MGAGPGAAGRGSNHLPRPGAAAGATPRPLASRHRGAQRGGGGGACTLSLPRGAVESQAPDSVVTPRPGRARPAPISSGPPPSRWTPWPARPRSARWTWQSPPSPRPGGQDEALLLQALPSAGRWWRGWACRRIGLQPRSPSMRSTPSAPRCTPLKMPTEAPVGASSRWQPTRRTATCITPPPRWAGGLYKTADRGAPGTASTTSWPPPPGGWRCKPATRRCWWRRPVRQAYRFPRRHPAQRRRWQQLDAPGFRHPAGRRLAPTTGRCRNSAASAWPSTQPTRTGIRGHQLRARHQQRRWAELAHVNPMGAAVPGAWWM